MESPKIYFKRSEPKKETFALSVFNEYFPDGKIKELRPEEIPENVMTYFESKSAELILPEDYKPKNFEKFFAVTHPDNKQTFLAQQTKKYSDKNLAEKVTYFADLENEKIMGRAELVLNIQCDKEYEEYYKNKPFVGWISTDKGAPRRAGLATRMILIMNAYSQMMYNSPLYSDIDFSPSGEKLTEKFVAMGKAKKFKEGPNDRYVFQIEKN